MSVANRPFRNHDRRSSRYGTAASSLSSPRPADPRFTDQLDRARAASIELAEDLLERSELVGKLDEILASRPCSSCKPGSDQAVGSKDQGAGSGWRPMSAEPLCGKLDSCPVTCSSSATSPRECGVVFAAFKGYESPLRHRPTLASCRSGGHAIWWTVEAETEADALRLLPYDVAERTTVSRVSEVESGRLPAAEREE